MVSWVGESICLQRKIEIQTEGIRYHMETFRSLKEKGYTRKEENNTHGKLDVWLTLLVRTHDWGTTHERDGYVHMRGGLTIQHGGKTYLRHELRVYNGAGTMERDCNGNGVSGWIHTYEG